jgi:predicted permease
MGADRRNCGQVLVAGGRAIVKALRAFLARFAGLFDEDERDRELAAEMDSHLEMHIEDNVQRGMTPAEARRQALIKLGGVEQTKENYRERRGLPMLETLVQDIRYALRMLRKSPAFTAVAILTLALGIGANTAIFSLIDGVMLRTMPVKDPSQIVMLRWQAHNFSVNGEYSGFGDCFNGDSNGDRVGCSFAIPLFEQFRSQVNAFSDVTAFAGPADLKLNGKGLVGNVGGEIVAGNYFSTLGVNTILGRTIVPSDDSLNASPVAVLSYAFWQSAFGGSRDVLGRTIELNDVPFTIVGVAEPSFTNLTPGKTQDLWFPIHILPRLNVSWGKNIDTLGNWWLVVLGRMKPAFSVGQAQAAATVIFRNVVLHAEGPRAKASDNPQIVLLRAQDGLTGSRGSYSQQLYVLMIAVGLVLLIACANVAGLLLARGAARQREMAVRLALGAGRARIWRQLLTESVLLSVAGGALGILFAYWCVRVIISLLSSTSSRGFPFTITPDWRVLLFVLGASVLTGIFFGLAPAFRSTRIDLTPVLKDAMGSASGRTRRLNVGGLLVVAQVALSVIVVIGAGLLVRTLENLRNANTGFDTRNLLLFTLDPTPLGYKQAQIQSLYGDLASRLAGMPGVVSVSYSSEPLASGNLWNSDVTIIGQPDSVNSDMLAVGPNFLQTMKIPLLQGRSFTAADFAQTEEANETGTRVAASNQPATNVPPAPVLVNREFVHAYLADRNPIGVLINPRGRDFTMGGGTGGTEAADFQIVGVIGDTKYSDLRRTIHPEICVPVVTGKGSFEVRTAANPTALLSLARETVKKVNADLEVFSFRTQTEQIDELLWQERLVARMSSIFGVLALGLACMGLYGLLSYEVARRTREIGIRIALGAQDASVLRLIVGRGIVLALAGAAVGIAAAVGVTQFMASLLYGIRPTDPVTMIGAAVLLVIVALAACYIPARRAMEVDPMVALRYE